MIAILSYGSGNVQAIGNIYRRLNVDFEIVEHCDQIARSEKIVLPGVGAFDQTMELLCRSGFVEPLNDLVLGTKVPVLGVCVGMQIMAKRSEEGTRPGLGWIDANVVKMKTSGLISKPLLPHMGWNSLEPANDHPILKGIDFEKGFYFLHSYCFQCENEENVLTRTHYGESFVSSVVRDNIFGFQFHPEKSHANGIRLFENFAKL